MKVFTLSLFILFCVALNAQKRVDKIIDAQGISTLQIDGNNCFKIHVTASQTNQILIQTRIVGEHDEDMIVVAKRSNDSLVLSTRFQPLFKADNDKLSVHKLMSVELEIQIPKHMNINIKSDIANVETLGVFNTAFIELTQGNCSLKSFSGTATVNTVQGDIYVETNYTKISGYSRHGVVEFEEMDLGVNHLNLKSIHGDISVFKTE